MSEAAIKNAAHGRTTEQLFDLVIEMLNNGDRSARHVARELSLSESLVKNWRERHREGRGAPGSKHVSSGERHPKAWVPEDMPLPPIVPRTEPLHIEAASLITGDMFTPVASRICKCGAKSYSGNCPICWPREA